MLSMFANVIIVIIIFVAVGFAIKYIHQSKKSGSSCIGCIHNGECNKKSTDGNTLLDNCSQKDGKLRKE